MEPNELNGTDWNVPRVPLDSILTGMKTSAAVIVAAVLSLPFFLTSLRAAETTAATRVYVAADGADAGVQTGGPVFPSLADARDFVRGLSSTARRGRVEIQLLPGIHTLAETVVFGIEDSPPEGGRLVILAEAGSPAILRGSVPVTGWRLLAEPNPELPQQAHGKIWVAPVPAGVDGKVIALYGRHGRLPRARSGPVMTYGMPAGYTDRWNPHQNFSFKGDVFKQWSNFNDVELAIVPARQFIFNVLELESIDLERSVVRTRLPATFHLLPYSGGIADACWIENSLEFLDTPGEWVYHGGEGLLYYWPEDGEPGDVRAGATVEMIRVEGDIVPDGDDTPVKGIEFRNLVFTESNRYTWNRLTSGLQHDIELHDAPNAMLRFRGAEDCVVEGCSFVQAAATGLRMDLHGRGFRVVGNRFEKLGGAGIVVGGYGPGTKDVNGGHEIAHNVISKVGEDYRVSPGMFLYQTGTNRVHHNLIHDVPYCGIFLSGNWHVDWQRRNLRERSYTIRRAETQKAWEDAYNAFKRDRSLGEASIQQAIIPFLHGRNNIIERNEIFAYMLKQGDGNAIYVAGVGSGNVIRENYVHDTLGPTASYAIRTDDHQYGTEVLNNLIVNVACGGLTLKQVNRFDGNIMVNLRESDKIINSYVIVQRGPLKGSSMSNNIFYYEQAAGETAAPVWWVDNPGGRPPAPLEDVEIDGNLYWTPKYPSQARQALEEMQARGKDLHGFAEDPLFIDPDNGDYRLQAGSPMRRLGLTGLHVDETGPQGEWRDRYIGKLATRLTPKAALIKDGEPVRYEAVTNSDDAVVRYTLDQSEPDSTSPVFRGMEFDRSAILRVRAFAPGQSDTRGALATIRHDSADFQWDISDTQPGGVPPHPLKFNGNVTLAQDPSENRIVRLVGGDAGNPTSLYVLHEMGRGVLLVSTRFRFAGEGGALTFAVRDAFTQQAAMTLKLADGRPAAKGGKGTGRLPQGEWIDANFRIDMDAGIWTGEFLSDGKQVAGLRNVPIPDPGLKSVNQFIWSVTGASGMALDVANINILRARQ